MTTAIRQGPSWALVETRILYDQMRGRQDINVYEGDVDGIQAVINGLQVYERFEADNSAAPIIRLIVYSPDLAEAPVFELLANHKEKHILEHPRYRTVSEHDVKTILSFLKSPREDAEPAITGGALALELYRLMLNKADKYFTEDYVLRYQVTATNATQLDLAYQNINKVLSPTALATPAVSGIILPAGISASIANITPPDNHSTAPYVWGWLKRAPIARQTQIGKVVIQGEWWLQSWHTGLYELVA